MELGRVSWLKSDCPSHVAAVPRCTLPGFGSVSFGFARLPRADGVPAGSAQDATHSPQPARRVCFSLKGKRILRLALACCCSEFTFGQRCLFPSYGEGYSGGPLVMLFILKWVNEMSQLLSVGGRLFSVSGAMPGSSSAHW